MRIVRRLPLFVLALPLLLLLAACGDGGPEAKASVRLWMPEPMGLGTFFRDFVAPGLLEERDIDLQVEEADIPFEEFEPTLRQSIGDGSLDADLVAVPAAMGRRLLEDGLLGEPVRILFSTEEELGYDFLAVMMAAPQAQSSALPGQPLVMAMNGVTVWKGPCNATVQALHHGRSPGPASPFLAPSADPPDEVEEFTQELVDNTAKNVGNKLKTEAVKDVAVELAEQYGAKTAGRFISRGFVIVGAVLDVINIFDALIELGGLMGDKLDTARNQTNSAFSAIDAMNDAQKDIADVIDKLVSCELDGEAAKERLEQIEQNARGLADNARDIASDMVTEGNDDSAQTTNELTDNIEDSIIRNLKDVRDLADRKPAGEAMPEVPPEEEPVTAPEPTPTPTPTAAPPEEQPEPTIGIGCDHRIPGVESDVIASVSGLQPGQTVSGSVTGPGVIGDGTFSATANDAGTAEARVPINQFGPYNVTVDGLSDSINVGEVCTPP